ncbi:MAG: adenosylcobinamide-GDP ribazoletransferase [Caldimicrobium sp.]|nr:adenosylcobinamide-GDP ribazoletransferase [Caldimicrobium sp.]MCX7614004.1 adenosylcobinamide-GDP ribazoletransferase [Caldimicrobium sp.]MDW8182871.1 adenosylcobinamide-GDP ribazoletransferase [Caldimicrobium sp.]
MLCGPFYAISFLWRLPLGIYPKSEKDFQVGIPFFPLVGFLEGFILFLVAKLLTNFVPSPLLALILIALLFFLRGIFHLDGLSDTFDALSYKGCGDKTRDVEKRLSIMKDSTVGVAGMTAVTLVILGKFQLFKEILQMNQGPFLILPYFISRMFLNLWLFLGKPARAEGLGYIMITHTNKGVFTLAIVISFILLSLIMKLTSLSLRDTLLLLLLNFSILFYSKRLFDKAFVGLTGDNLGALVILSEIITLLYLVIIWPKL